MAFDADHLPDDVLAFLAEPHLATLTTTSPGGRLHVTAVCFTYDPADQLVRIITSGDSQKARNAGRGGRAAVGQVDGPRWLSLEGRVLVSADPGRVSRAETEYGRRYHPPRRNARRVAIEIAVDRILGRVGQRS